MLSGGKGKRGANLSETGCFLVLYGTIQGLNGCFAGMLSGIKICKMPSVSVFLGGCVQINLGSCSGGDRMVISEVLSEF